MQATNDAQVERAAFSANGYLAVLIGLAAIGWLITQFAGAEAQVQPTTVGLCVLVIALCFGGLYMLQPNEGAALQLFGAYVGTDRKSGLRWTIPLFTRRRISLRVRNFLSDKLKVNDERGNPIEIAAAIVWRVDDTARALFNVDDYDAFVRIQSEAALREIASSHPYDSIEAEGVPAARTLRGGSDLIAEVLAHKLNERLGPVGLLVEETRLTHLAYAPEIANAMLRRQQAEAVIAARRKIVDSAVGMVELALNALSERRVVELDDERKAAMVSNLLVVLCSEQEVKPVVNSGTLYP
ncbi:SPFH domain-containing protein [Niveibacterium sp.]|uniref:SPFH domain-containing protein n=1 Tax=Niveibacterium sp. TaxID=2017444 RepID=UPI0035AEAF64